MWGQSLVAPELAREVTLVGEPVGGGDGGDGGSGRRQVPRRCFDAAAPDERANGTAVVRTKRPREVGRMNRRLACDFSQRRYAADTILEEFVRSSQPGGGILVCPVSSRPQPRRAHDQFPGQCRYSQRRVGVGMIQLSSQPSPQSFGGTVPEESL